MSKDRQQIVAELMGQGIESPSAIRAALRNRGIVNETTGKPFSRRTIVRDMDNLASVKTEPTRKNGSGSSLVKETIGRTRRSYHIRYHDHLMQETADQTQADYAFYDELRRGGIEGLEIAGNFSKVVASKTAGWCMGQLPQIKHENDALEQELNNWLSDNLPDIIQFTEDMVALGDFYMAINPDLSLTPLMPNTIEPIVSEMNYKDVVGWEVRERINHPTRMEYWQIETNIYTAEKRMRLVEFAKGPAIDESYPNLIGRLNVVAMHNNKQTNDVYGTPEVAPLVKTSKSLLFAYNEVLRAAINGNIRIGRPTPTIEFKDFEQMEQFMAENADTITRERLNEITGEIESVSEYYIDFDADQLLTLSGASFKYAQPGEISRDTEALLGLLFVMMVQILEIPEFVMGGELTSSRSTAEVQMEVFEQWVSKKRGQFQKWLLEMLKVVALFIGASTPGIGSVDVDGIELVWEPLTGKDGKLTLEALAWAYSQGLIDKTTALMLAPIDIEDVAAVLEAVEAEDKARQSNRDAQFAALNYQELQMAQLQAGQDA